LPDQTNHEREVNKANCKGGLYRAKILNQAASGVIGVKGGAPPVRREGSTFESPKERRSLISRKWGTMACLFEKEVANGRNLKNMIEGRLRTTKKKTGEIGNQ